MAKTQWLAAGLAVLSLAGCSIVSSHQTDLNQQARRTGVLYMLPKALLQIQVTDTGGNLAATIFNPTLVGDPAASYLLSYDASVLSADTLKVDVNSKTSLLQLVDAKAEDKTAEIIKKLAQTAAVIAQSGTTGAETVLYNKTFDPATDRQTIETEINQVIGEYLGEKAACAGDADPCGRYKALNGRIIGGSTLFALSIGEPQIVKAAATPPASVVGQGASPTVTDCTIGICYRPVVPYQISAKLGYRVSSVTVFLPNEAPAIALPLDRFMLVTSTHKVTLKDGLLASVETNKPSEALALASIPLDVLEAVMSSLTKFAGLGAGLARAQTDQLKAEMELQKQIAMQQQLKPQSGLLGGPDGVLLQVTTGSTSILPTNIGGGQSTDVVTPPPPAGAANDATQLRYRHQ